MTHSSLLPLEEVLDMLLDEYSAPSREAIAAYSCRFPEYRADLLRFAATWAEEENLREPVPLNNAQRNTLEARAQSFLQNALYDDRASAASPIAVSGSAASRGQSLVQLAQSAGRKLHDVAREVGMPLPFISELNGRGFKPETIPDRLVRRLASVLGVAPSRVTASWAGPPTIQPSMGFLATSKPISRPQRDFVAAVNESDMSPDEKAALLDDD